MEDPDRYIPPEVGSEEDPDRYIPPPREAVRTPDQIAKSLKAPAEETPEERRIQRAREYYSQKAESYFGPGTPRWAAERFPFAGTAVALGEYAKLHFAAKAKEEGKATPEDLDYIGLHQARRDYESSKSTGKSIGEFVTKVPAMVGEFAAGGFAGRAVKGAVAGAMGGRAGAPIAGYAAGLAAQTAATPSMYIDHAVQVNEENKRLPLDPRGFGKAGGLAVAQMAILGVVSEYAPGIATKLTGVDLGGAGVGQAAKRVGLQAGLGPFSQAAQDLVGHSLGLQTHYGTVEEILDGRYGDALKSSTMQAFQYGTFAVAHEIVTGAKGPEEAKKAAEKIKTVIDDAGKAGATPEQAAKVLNDRVLGKSPYGTDALEARARGSAERPDVVVTPPPKAYPKVSDEDLVDFAKGLFMDKKDMANPKKGFSRQDAEKYLLSKNIHEEMIGESKAKPSQVIQPEKPPEAVVTPPPAPPEAPVAPPASPTPEVAQKPAAGMIDRPGGPYVDSPHMRGLVAEADVIRANLPPAPEGMTRLWRGGKASEKAGDGTRFTDSLEGIALPFSKGYKGQLRYVDVPTKDLPKYVNASEPNAWNLPREVAKQARDAKPAPVEAKAPEPVVIPPEVAKFADDLHATFDAAGLTAREKHVVTERLERTQEDIGADPEVRQKGVKKPLSRERVRQIEAKAVAKIEAWKKANGVKTPPIQSLFKSVIQPEQASAKQDLTGQTKVSREAETVIDYLNSEGPSKDNRTPEEKLVDAWGTYLQRSKNEIGNLTPEQHAAHDLSVGEAIANKESPPAKGLYEPAAPGTKAKASQTLLSRLKDLYSKIETDPSTSLNAIDEMVVEVSQLPVKEARQLAEDFGIRLGSGATKNQAAAEIGRKLTQLQQTRGRTESIDQPLGKPNEKLTQAAGEGLKEAYKQAGEGEPKAEDLQRLPGEVDSGAVARVAAEAGVTPAELEQRLAAAESKPAPGFGKPLTESERVGANLPGGGQPGIGEAEQRTEAPKRETALQNSEVDKERVRHGLPPLMAEARKANAEVWDEAMAKLDKDPEAGARLVEDLVKNPRATKVEENALLLHRKIALKNDLERAAIEGLRAMKGSALDIAEADARYDSAKAKIDQLDKVTRATGTEWGRAGQFRRQLALEDFSLGKMLMEATLAKGRPLNAEERAEIVKLSQRIEELQKRLDEATANLGDAKFGSTRRNEWSKAGADLARAQGGFRDRIADSKNKQESPIKRFGDWLVKYRINAVISAPTVLAKIAAASPERMGATLLEEVAGQPWRMIPGISKIAAMAPRHGRPLDLAKEMKLIQVGVTKGIEDAVDVLKTGKSDVVARHGKYEGAREWSDLQFSLHEALKQPAVTAEFTRSMLDRTDFDLAHGRDVTSPAAIMRNEALAHQDSLASKGRQDNWLVDAYNSFVNKLRSPNASGVSQGVGLGFKLATPVVRIPTNLAFEVGEHVFGATVLGPSKYLKARFVTGLENLQPAEADAIMRSFKKGTLGVVGMLLGAMNPDMFGGYYSGKRDEKDVKAGALRIGGADVPSWLLHNPLLETFQVGATMRRVYDKLIKKGDSAAVPEAAWETLNGWLNEQPLVRGDKEISHLTGENAKERGYYWGETLKSLAVPQFVQWMAGQMDKNAQGEPIKRKPTTVGQHVKMGIPGLRKTVPAR